MVVLNNHSRGFREEMIATAVIISITVMGSFILLGQFTPNQKKTKSAVLGSTSQQSETPTHTKPTEQNQNDVSNNPELETMPTPTPTPTVTPTPTPDQQKRTIPYGVDQEFENDYYKVTFSNPRVIAGTSRLFKVDVIVANIAVDAGIKNTLKAGLTLNGNNLSSTAPMTASETQTIMPKQQLTFEASISLPENVDIDEVIVEPGNELPEITYKLAPTL